MAMTYSGTVPAPWIGRAVEQFNPLNQRFAAIQAARPIRSREKEGTLPYVKRADTMGKNLSLARAPGANYDRGHITVAGTAFNCIDYGFEHKVPKETKALFRSIVDALVVAGQTVKGELYTGREKRVGTLLQDTTVWTGSSLITDNHANPWDAAGTDIIGQVGAAKEKVRKNCGLEANALLCNAVHEYDMVYLNTAIKALLQYTVTPTIAARRAFLAGVLGLEQVIVFGAVYSAGNEADALPTITDIWGEDQVMVARVAVTDDPSEPCVARIVVWDGMQGGNEVAFDQYYEPQSKSTIVQGDLYEDELVVDKYCGHMIEVDPTS